MPGEPCLRPGCEMVGVFPGVRVDGDSEVRGFWCFTDDPTDNPLNPPLGELIVVGDDAPSFHTDVTNGLAAMILEHTAMTTLDTPDATGDAMRLLAKATGMTLDVAAGILVATTGLMAMGGIDPAMILATAEVWEAMAEDDDDPSSYAVDPSEPGAFAPPLPEYKMCLVCDGTGLDDPEDPSNLDECPVCNGQGEIDVKEPEQDPVDWTTCSTCDGTGVEAPPGPGRFLPCSGCAGTGVVRTNLMPTPDFGGHAITLDSDVTVAPVAEKETND